MVSTHEIEIFFVFWQSFHTKMLFELLFILDCAFVVKQVTFLPFRPPLNQFFVFLLYERFQVLYFCFQLLKLRLFLSEFQICLPRLLQLFIFQLVYLRDKLFYFCIFFLHNLSRL